MNYQEAIDYLESLNTFGVNLGLSRITELVARMGNPERKFKSIHVTGTNGKGSVTAMLTSILNHAGYKTGMYISPHLVDYTERLSIGGKPISQEHFASVIADTKKYVDELVHEGFEHPTQFEVITAAAFYCFAVAGVDIAVIEVGLGGELDSTNVIQPEVAVITNVTLEHTDRCGNTVAEIAKVKSGIIKKEVPVVTGAEGDGLNVIKAHAREKNAPVFILNLDFKIISYKILDQKQTAEFLVNGKLISIKLNLQGINQVQNAALALMAIECLNNRGFIVKWDYILQGLESVTWPARFEIFPGKPLLIIDGAHNPDGARSLRENLDYYFPGKRIVFLLGMLKDKDIQGVVKQLIKQSDCVIAVSPESPRAATPEYLSKEIEDITGAKVDCFHDLELGLEKARKMALLSDKVLCITGSLYMVGHIREMVL